MIDKNERLIKAHAAKAFETTEDKVLIINRLMGGMSHLTYHIRIENKDYTYRIIGMDGNLFVDRKTELENLNRIIPLKLNNETVYFDVVSGDKAAKFVEGAVLTDLDFHEHLSEIVFALKTLHQTKIEPASDYELIKRLDLYETFTNIRSNKYLELKKVWVKKYLKERASQPKVFCHNDAQRSNIVIGQKQLYLLDWEYAGYNEFYYDIASFGNVKFEDALVLLDAYLGRKATKKEQDIVRFYRMFQALQWHQVATRKDISGLSKDVGFDFKMLAEKYLDLAEKLYLEMN